MQGEALVNALLLGKIAGLNPEIVSLFARTGLIHLFSASGFHMAVAVQMARFCTLWPERWLKYRVGIRIASLLLQLLFMIFFGRATGWSSPMVRAFTFTTLLAAARLLEVTPSKGWVFLLSLLVSALFGKGSFLSFLLSACGMAGVLFIQPRKFWAITLGPWLLTAPVIIWEFGIFSAAAPLWNLTIGNLIAWLVMPPAVLHLICATAALPDPFLPLAAWAMSGCTGLLEIGDNLIGGAFWVPKIPWLVLSAALVLAIQFGGRKKTPFCAVIFIFGLFSPLPRLAMLDVGQGDSIFFRTAGGEKILMDIGPPGFKGNDARSAQELGKIGVGSVDQIMLSHLDLDHRGGLDSLLSTHRVHGSLWLREEALRQKSAPKVLAALERVNVPIRFLTPRKSPENIRCYFAPALNSNDLSPLCIARLPREESIWLTGDISSKAEAWILAHQPDLPPTDYLKIAHHGSRTSSSSAFLRASGAKLALISVGVKNRYGHPTREALDRIEEAAMQAHRTDQEGDLVYY